MEDSPSPDMLLIDSGRSRSIHETKYMRGCGNNNRAETRVVVVHPETERTETGEAQSDTDWTGG